MSATMADFYSSSWALDAAACGSQERKEEKRRRTEKKRRKKKLPKSGGRLLIHAFGRLSSSFYVKAHSVPEVDAFPASA